MRSPFGPVLVASLLVAGAAVAQTAAPGSGKAWGVTLGVGTSTFTGATASTDPAAGDLVFRPHRPTMVGLGVTYGREGMRIGLAAKYGQPGLGFRGVPEEGDLTPLLLVAENAFSLTSITASAGTRIATLRGGPALRSSLGVTMEVWSADGTPNRTVVGPQAGLGLEFEVAGSLVAQVDGELGFTPGSPFLEADLPEGFRRRSTWRRTLQAGLGLRF